MTKKEYVALHAPAATEMVGNKTFLALLETAREENPFLAMGQQELAVLQLGGAAIGWHKCLEFLKTAHLVPEKKPEREHTPAYRDPNAEESKLQRPENKPK